MRHVDPDSSAPPRGRFVPARGLQSGGDQPAGEEHLPKVQLRPGDGPARGPPQWGRRRTGERAGSGWSGRVGGSGWMGEKWLRAWVTHWLAHLNGDTAKQASRWSE